MANLRTYSNVWHSPRVHKWPPCPQQQGEVQGRQRRPDLTSAWSSERPAPTTYKDALASWRRSASSGRGHGSSEPIGDDIPLTEMHVVDSGNIEAVGYDLDTRELHIRFTSGSVYVYFDVDGYLYEKPLRADSKGSYFNRIKRWGLAYDRR